jgi:hypothetical protein
MAAKLGALTGVVPSSGLGAAAFGYKGAAGAGSVGGVTGALAGVGKLAAKDPAARAYLMDRVNAVFSFVPNLTAKYGTFLGAGARVPAIDLASRLQHLMRTDPEFAKAWQATEQKGDAGTPRAP